MNWPVLLAGLLLFHFAANLIWIYLNSVPPTWDAALHSVLTFKMLAFLKANLLHFNIVEFLRISEYYPPFVHMTGIPFAFLTGENYKALQVVGTIYFIIAIGYLYRYTNLLFKNKAIAFFTAFCFSFFITNYQQSRDFMLDIPSIAFIMASLYYQEKSDYFQKKKESFLFFISLGLAIMTKWTSVIFIIVPSFYMFIEMFIKHKEKFKLRHIITNMVIGILIVLTICTPWFAVNFKRFLEIAKITSQGELADPQNLFSAANLLFNLNLLVMYQMTFIGFIFFLFALIAFGRADNKKTKVIVLATLIVGYGIFTFISNKNIRYTMPLTPFFAMVVGYGLYTFMKRSSRFIFSMAGMLVVCFLVVSYFILSFGIPFYPTYRLNKPLPVVGGFDFVYLHDYPVKVAYDTHVWPNQKILTDVYDNSVEEKREGNLTVLNLVDREYMNWYNFDPLLYDNIPPDAKNRIHLSFVPFLSEYKSDAEMKKYLSTYIDYVLVPKKQIGLPEAIREYEHMYRFQQFFLNRKATDFILMGAYEVPGNVFYTPDTYYLYKKQASPL